MRRDNSTSCSSLTVRLWSFLSFLLGFSLLVSAGYAQSYSPLYPPYSGTFTQTWYCTDQAGHIVYWCNINLITDYYAFTNAHFHESYPHPKSSIRCTSYLDTCSTYDWTQDLTVNTGAFGYVKIYVGTTLIGQAENVHGTSLYGSFRLNFAVGYGDVFYNDHPEIWVKIGGSDTGGGTGHGTTAYNRYMKLYNPPYWNDGPAYWLYYATNDYLGAHPGTGKVCTNDMALPYGGKFDIYNFPGIPGCTSVTPWQSPHIEHDRGTAGDVAGIGSAQCANAGGSGVVIADFVFACQNRGGNWSYNEGNHAHCGFENPATFPH